MKPSPATLYAVRLPLALLDALKARAAREASSVSGVIRSLLAAGITSENTPTRPIRKRRARMADEGRDSLWVYLARSGGIRRGDLFRGELARIAEMRPVGLLRRHGGMGLDDALTEAVNAGYPVDDLASLLGALEDDVSGRRVYSIHYTYTPRELAALEGT